MLYPSLLIHVSRELGQEAAIELALSTEARGRMGRSGLVIPHPDVRVVDESPSIGIEVIRDLAGFINQKPYQLPYKTVVLLHADRLTVQAQNALLKTLEEPPENTQIVLVTDRPQVLLETILSRCQMVEQKHATNLDSPFSERADQFPQDYPSAFALAETLGKSREEAIAWCESMLIHQKKQLEDTPTLQTQDTLRHLIHALKRLRRNVHARATLEGLFFACQGLTLR